MPEVEAQHAARGIGHKEPRESGDDAIGAGRGGREGGRRNPGEWGVAVVRDDLFDNRLGKECVDGEIVTIGEVVGSVRLVDETDIK